MKKLFFLFFVLIIAWSCSPTHKSGSSARDKVVQIDSTEYEITILDNDFDHWYLLNYAPSKDYTNEYYRSKNQVGVGKWNDYYTRGKYNRVIENNIYYNYSTDYGIEVNRKLFWYFKFIEETYHIRLLK